MPRGTVARPQYVQATGSGSEYLNPLALASSSVMNGFLSSFKRGRLSYLKPLLSAFLIG